MRYAPSDSTRHREKETGNAELSTRRVVRNRIRKGGQLTIGMDLGDRWSYYCVLGEGGKIVLEQKLPTTEAMKRIFEK